MDLPGLFVNTKQADAVLDGDIGTEALNWMEGQGIIGLAWWENGFRELTNNKHEIAKPEDLDGIKLRTMENDVHIEYFRFILPFSRVLLMDRKIQFPLLLRINSMKYSRIQRFRIMYILLFLCFTARLVGINCRKNCRKL